MLLSQRNAALSEADCLAQTLAHRYRHAAENMVDSGPARSLFRELATRHETLSARLQDELARDEVLPRDPDLDLEDLQKLMDQVSSWLGEDEIRSLAQRFSDQEQELRGHLEAARDADAALDRLVREAAARIDASVNDLEAL